jgi:hypothetical protein
LVVQGSDGKAAPGLAASWEASGDALVLTLSAGVDGTVWAQAISERIAGAAAVFSGGELTITGVPPDNLLDRLASLTLAGHADPLAELAGLGGAVAMDTPEGGGSIRASKPMAVGGGPRTLAAHDPGERFEAEVVAVRPGAFPQVKLELKMRKGGRKSALRKKLYYGKLIEASVVYNVADGLVDLGDEANRRNLGAWYLKKADRVYIHVVEVNGGYEIDWLTRK